MSKNQEEFEKLVQVWRIRRLFRAVLVQAAKDAYQYEVKSIRQRKRRREALRFFKNTDDLKRVCDLAEAPCYEIFRVAHNSKLSRKGKYNKIILLTFKKALIYC